MLQTNVMNISIIPINMSLVFSKTNKLWNSNKFNSPETIGSLMKIAKNSRTENWMDFQNYYYITGNKRQQYYSLNDIDSSYLNTKKYRIDLNIDFDKKWGRNKEFINDLIGDWYCVLRSNGFNITKEFAKLSVYQRLFVETFKGYYMETKICEILNDTYKNLVFRKASPIIDSEYNIDIECFKNDKLVGGLQVKPSSYFRGKNKDWFKTAHKKNIETMNKYMMEYNANVGFIKYEFGKTFLDLQIALDRGIREKINRINRD